MATNQSIRYPFDYYVAVKVCEQFRKQWKDFKVPLDVYDDKDRCILTLEQVLEFSFVCNCGHRNEVDFIKVCSPQTAIYLKKRAELEWHIRQSELRLERIQHGKESLQLDRLV